MCFYFHFYLNALINIIISILNQITNTIQILKDHLLMLKYMNGRDAN